MITVVKIGGGVIDRTSDLESCLGAFADLDGPKILVHGGGRKASQLSTAMGIEPALIEGRRITDSSTLEIVTMVYAGLINKQIVARLQAYGCHAAGFSGADLDLIRCRKRPPNPIDFGFVGDIEKINSIEILKLIENGIAPVMCPLTHDGQGQLLNTNADTIASQIAISLSASEEVDLRLCFEMDGVLANPNDQTSLQKQITFSKFQELKSAGSVHSGMIPKLDNAFVASKRGVTNVRIGSFRNLAELGTLVLHD